MLERGYADVTGRPLSSSAFEELRVSADRAGTDLNRFMQARGVQQFEVRHPADRFWTFQLVEAALFVGVAALLIAVVVWRIHRRVI